MSPGIPTGASRSTILLPQAVMSFAAMMVDGELAESSNSTSRSAIDSRAAASWRAAQGLMTVRRFLWFRQVLRSARVFSYAPRDPSAVGVTPCGPVAAQDIRDCDRDGSGPISSCLLR
jgi:hypothetical protein